MLCLKFRHGMIANKPNNSTALLRRWKLTGMNLALGMIHLSKGYQRRAIEIAPEIKFYLSSWRLAAACPHARR